MFCCLKNGVQAEAAAAQGERAVRGFMTAVKRATANAASLQQVRLHHTRTKIGSFECI